VERPLRLLRRLTCALGAVAVGGALAAVPPAARAADVSPPAYKSLRYDETWTSLRDPAKRTDWLDPIKYVRLDDEGDAYLTLGGEIRERYELFDDYLWGDGPQDDDGYLLQRYMLHADVHAGDRVRVFLQLKSGIESGRDGGPRPPDEDVLDVHQAFADARVPLRSGALTLRLGRQELQYGSARLVSAREGPNVRQSFDAVRIIAQAGAWRVDVFGSRPVETDPQVFDDDPDRARWFWGVYATGPSFVRGGGVDLYYLGLDREQAEFDDRTAGELRHSFGARLFGSWNAWDYNFEVVDQLGRYGTGTIAAWTVASDTGYTVRGSPFAPRVALKANVASGNHGRRDLQTFNPLFPRGSYFGEPGLIGPANFMDVHPVVELHPHAAVTISTDWDVFWRQSTRDGLYGNAVNLVRSSGASRARFVGSQLQTALEWRIDRHVTVTLVYAHFFTGRFLEETRPGRDVDFTCAWATYRF